MPGFRRLLIVAGLSLLAAACGAHTPASPTPPPSDPPPVQQPPPPPPAPTPVLGITRILAFGDSMTEGVIQPSFTVRALTAGLPVSYPYKLQDLLAARYTAQTIVTLNAGMAGHTAQDDRARLGPTISEAAPELLLLMEGANDLNKADPSDPSNITKTIDATAAAMEDMVRDAKGRGVKVMVATLPPQRPGGSRAGAATFVNRYNDALKQMAAKKDAILVDVNAQFPLDLIGQDGLHPTEAGYDKLAGIFRDAIVATFDITPTSLTR
jgi:lysophospholipase L1-like esterase